MKNNKSIIFTVTTDLSYDQRMQRICNSLANAGYDVTLVGRLKKDSIPLKQQSFKQTRLNCMVEKGKLFYAIYNLRLLIYLFFKKTDAICAIDLDTIIPCYVVSMVRNKKRIYDAHELFCEMKEIATRPGIYKIWKAIEKFAVPRFKYGYTVNKPIAAAFNKMYGAEYEIIRNIALLREQAPNSNEGKYLLYQGAVNEGRCFETLIPAMRTVDSILMICGDGNFMKETKALVKLHQLEKKVIFKGNVPPVELRAIALQAYAGITLFDDTGKSNYYSLANRFFDYLHAGIPQLCVGYPVYEEINNKFPVALLVTDTSSNNLSLQLNNLLNNKVLYDKLKLGCEKAKFIYNWQEEEKKLLSFYEEIW